MNNQYDIKESDPRRIAKSTVEAFVPGLSGLEFYRLNRANVDESEIWNRLYGKSGFLSSFINYATRGLGFAGSAFYEVVATGTPIAIALDAMGGATEPRKAALSIGGILVAKIVTNNLITYLTQLKDRNNQERSRRLVFPPI